MDPTTVVIIFSFAWGGLILYRIHRRRQQTQAKGESTPPAMRRAAPDTDRSMPRFGKPGSITFNQIQALRRNGFTPDRSWSREEAALILDGVKYLRAVCRDVGDEEDGPPPIEIQNELLRFILTSQDLRDHVRKWGEDRRAAGHGEFDDDDPDLPHNDQYARVAARARDFLSPPDAPG